MSARDRIGVIFSKEVIDNLRDRRSLVSGLIGALIGPGLLLLIIIIVGKSMYKDQQDKRLQIPLVGEQNAPTLVEFLRQNEAEIQPGPADPEGEVRSGGLDFVLVIPESFKTQFSAGAPATVRLVVDTSRQSAMASMSRVRQLLEAYNQQTAALRLIARGVSPVILEPLAVERVDVATPQSQAMIFLNMMPYFVVMVVFMGGMHVIIDATAGERERGSLEPLLINPAARWEMVTGKLLASLPFATLALFANLVAFAVAFNVFPLEEYVGIQLSLDLQALFGIFLVALPMIPLASGLQMIIASYTRSFKEAQTYVGLLPIIPALPGLGLAFLPVKPTVWAMLIPTFSQQLLINQLMRGESIQPGYVIVSMLFTLAVAAGLIWIAIQQYQKERILFGTK